MVGLEYISLSDLGVNYQDIKIVSPTGNSPFECIEEWRSSTLFSLDSELTYPQKSKEHYPSTVQVTTDKGYYLIHSFHLSDRKRKQLSVIFKEIAESQSCKKITANGASDYAAVMVLWVLQVRSILLAQKLHRYRHPIQTEVPERSQEKFSIHDCQIATEKLVEVRAVGKLGQENSSQGSNTLCDDGLCPAASSLPSTD